MAVIADRYDSDLVLELYIGTNDEGKDLKKTKSISKINSTATDEQLYAVGTAIAEVLKYEVIEFRRINKNLLIG
ncbi:hypothetical protein GCM10008905_31560 [Clostridium malenominatum]|uniref:DUF1659 domain-containing protein n=1 Tax=Clostridium malenominatum TaxID=1539 RepID=A0ABP3UFY4_9CLOT